MSATSAVQTELSVATSPSNGSASLSSPSSVNPPTSYAWEGLKSGSKLLVSPSFPSLVRNTGSGNQWQMVRSLQSFSTGFVRVGVRVVKMPPSTNNWRSIVGVTPENVDCSGRKQWVGTDGSWGYISSSGGKCHQLAKSETYGAPYGEGDVVGVIMDFSHRMLTFFKNGVSQGVAFTNLVGPVHIAASLTSTDSVLELIPF